MSEVSIDRLRLLRQRAEQRAKGFSPYTSEPQPVGTLWDQIALLNEVEALRAKVTALTEPTT